MLNRLLVVLTLLLSGGVLPGQVLRFGVIGDSGTGDERQRSVARAMDRWQAAHPWEFVLMAGDNIYEDGKPEYFDAKFKLPYKALLDRGVRFHAALGNHDRVHPSARLGCAQVEDPAFGFLDRRDEYVLEEGPVIGGKRLARILVLNSNAWIDQYVDGKNDATACRGTTEDRLAQLKGWLKQSGRYHWNILLLHHPLYSHVIFSGLFGGHGSSKRLREILEPLLKNRANVVFAGHDHYYQRIKPQQGIHHFVVGGAAKLRFGGNSRHRNVAYGARRKHFLDVELTRGELKFKAVDENGQVFDSGSIVRPGASAGLAITAQSVL